MGHELIFLFVIALLLFGADKLPEIARVVGKSLGEFKRMREDFEREIARTVHNAPSHDVTTRNAHPEIPQAVVHEETKVIETEPSAPVVREATHKEPYDIG